MPGGNSAGERVVAARTERAVIRDVAEANQRGEDPRWFFQQVLHRGPYYEVYRLLEDNPDLVPSGRVYDLKYYHYVHENSTKIELTLEGSMAQPGDDEYPSDPSDHAQAVFGRFQDSMQDEVRAWNHDLTKDLYAALEDEQSDETISEWMNANEWRFDDQGEQVDMTDFVPVSNLPEGVRNRVLQQYVELFDRTPEEVYAALMKRDVRFDQRGSKVDTSQFKRIDELDPKMRSKILDKNRYILTEHDDFWAESVEDDWKTKLEELGFERVEIRYSLGYSQGDGASFTADSIDVRKLIVAFLTQAKIEAAAKQLVSNLLE